MDDKVEVLTNLFADLRDQVNELKIEMNEKIDSVVSHLNEKLAKNLIKKENYSLAHNVSLESMKQQGYTVAYDYLYSHWTKYSKLNEIRSKCLPETLLCAGGAAAGSDILLLVSCGKCQSVLTPTPRDLPVLNNGAYWYFTEGDSFGYSPTQNIKQDDADWYDCEIETNIVSRTIKNCKDDKRLSWDISNYRGTTLITGSIQERLGRLNGFEHKEMKNYRKILLIG